MCSARQGRVVWLACVLSCGCAQTAKVTYWRPAEVGAPGLQRLAVMPFAGERGADFAGLLESRLWDEDTYTVVDQSELGPAILPAAFPQEEISDWPQFVAAAQQAGVDGIILGEVLEIGVGRSLRDARVALSLQLIDARSGEVCASREIRREGAVRTGEGPPPSEEEVLNQLAQGCLEEFMGLLVAQPATAEVGLAAGEWYGASALKIRRGIRLARQGRWDDAEVLWHEVLSRNPTNHAALYNLAVAAGQRQDFVAAEDYAMQALRQRHTDCYAKGLDQLRQFRADADRIARQRQGQVLPASLAARQD